MKFRGKITDIMNLHQFTRIVNTVSKLTKNCILRLTTSKLYFIMADGMGNGGVGVWCELTQDQVFDEYNMEGVSEEYNEIFMEISSENISKVLKLAQNAKTVKLKLMKKLMPCLTFEIELPSLCMQSRMVIHDIPVNVIPRKCWDDYQEPEMPNFDISIFMPSLRILRNIADRMKNLSTYIILHANKSGEMKLGIETDNVTVATHFDKLEIATLDTNNDASQRQVRHSAEARIDIRRLVQFLSSHQVNPNRVMCNIKDGRMVQFVLLHNDMTLQYFIPAVEL